jgi:hypothetical protein
MSVIFFFVQFWFGFAIKVILDCLDFNVYLAAKKFICMRDSECLGLTKKLVHKFFHEIVDR